jgi:serine/threonine-protein kinase
MSLARAEQLLGPYAVGTKIGGGGMASVHLGSYVAAPGEEAPRGQEVVALKIVRGELATNPEYEKMFLDEAAILTQLAHPNVIRTVGYGAQNNMWFIAMELLMGRCLMDIWDAAAIEKKTIPFDLAAWIAREVARGLHYAHELADAEDGHHLHLIHRDVNPSNVFVSYDGTVKLIDFGLAKARNRQTKSAEGVIKGKIPYLSPEQITDGKIDRRTDIYALGATLWEMTTMRRLFKRDTDIDTIRAIEKGEIPDPRTFIPDYPQPLWRVVERALWRDRDGRYSTAQEMAEDLDQFLGSKPDAEFRALIAQLVDKLFPGEAKKQHEWLADAVGDGDRASFVPPVPLAEVPAREKSMPDTGELEMALTEPAPPPPEHPPVPPPTIKPIASVPPPPRHSDPPPSLPRRRRGNPMRDFGVFLLIGVVAGLAIVGALNALHR